jgi:hypothetical protein
LGSPGIPIMWHSLAESGATFTTTARMRPWAISIRTRSAQPVGSRNDWNHKLIIGL